MAEGKLTALEARVDALVRALADDQDVEVLRVGLNGPRNRQLLRITADADGGLDLDQIASLSRAVSEALDEQDLIPGSYTLEVTSPGADREMSTAADFARAIDREVRVTHGDPDAPAETVGQVVEVTDATLVLDVDGNRTELDLDDVRVGKVVLPW